MKKTVALLLALVMIFALSVCHFTESFAEEIAANADENDTRHYEGLKLIFFPFKDHEETMNTIKYLPAILKQEMAEQGFTIDNISIEIGETYADTAEALVSGEADIAWLPSGTYAAYEEGAAVMLTAARHGLSNDSTDAATWNGDDNRTRSTDEQVSFYRGLILAGPSEYGKALAEKAANGEKISWEELGKATWAVQKTISSAGYIYPSMWLMNNYDGKGLDDLSNVIPLNGYRRAVILAAEEKADIILLYSDARMEFEKLWTMPVDETGSSLQSGMGRSTSIWEELQVLAVTEPIFDDTVAISRQSPFYTPDAAKALQTSLMNIISSNVGQTIFSIYDHSSYVPGSDADYDIALAAFQAVNRADEADIIDLPDSAEGKGETIDPTDVEGLNITA